MPELALDKRRTWVLNKQFENVDWANKRRLSEEAIATEEGATIIRIEVVISISYNWNGREERARAGSRNNEFECCCHARKVGILQKGTQTAVNRRWKGQVL